MLHQQQHTVVIPGTRRQTHLRSNWAAGQIRLDAAQLDTLNHVFAPGSVAGERYTEKGWVGIESARG